MNHGRLRVTVLMAADALALVLAWGVSVLGSCLAAPAAELDWQYVLTRWPFVLIYVCLNIFARLYHGNPAYPGLPLPQVEEFRRVTLTTVATGVLFFAYLSFYGKTTPLPSWVPVMTVVLNIPSALLLRGLLRRALMRLRVGQIPAVLLGPDHETAFLARVLETASYYGIAVRGRFEKTREALAFACGHDIKHCISCQPLRVFRRAFQALMGRFSVIVSMPEPQIFPVALTHAVELDGYGGVEMANQLRQRGTRAIKTFSEILLTMGAVIVLMLPALGIVLLLWCAYGRRRIFYTTQRLGKCGRPFTIWKFQTMVPDADRRLKELLDARPDLAEEWASTGKLRNDPRITCVGRWLRRTSLDEVPQLWNVLRREMALIGPRPIVTREVPLYGGHYDTIASVKPGITGLWQVSGRSDTDYDRRAALDMYYVRNWSLWLDGWILMRTVAVVLLQRGAR